MKLKQNFTIVSSILTIMLALSVVISQLYVLFEYENSTIAIVLILMAVAISLAGCILSAMLCNKKFIHNRLIGFANLGIVIFLFVIFILAMALNFKIYGFYYMLPMAIVSLTLNIVSVSLSDNY